jgi:hypothetical protein
MPGCCEPKPKPLRLRFPHHVRQRAMLCGVETTEIRRLAKTRKSPLTDPRPGALVCPRGGRSPAIQISQGRSLLISIIYIILILISQLTI